MSDPTPNGQTWVCRADFQVYGSCNSPVGSLPGHNGCGPVPPAPSSDERAPFADLTDEEFAVFAEGAGFDPAPSSDTPSDERARLCDGSGRFVGTASAGKPCPECGGSDTTIRGWVIRHYMPRPTPPPTPVDGDSGRRGKAQIMATALHDAGVNTTVSASDNGLLIRVHDRHTPRLLELLAPPPVGEERRPGRGLDVTALPEWEALRTALEIIDGEPPWPPDVEVAARALLAAADRGEPTP